MGVRIGTRGSQLAVTQSQHTADQLAAVGGFETELIRIKTDGDVLTGPLSQMGGTGVFAVALRDSICPPSTVFAAYNHYGSRGGSPVVESEICVYPFNHHEGGDALHVRRQLEWLRERVPVPPRSYGHAG